MNNKSYCLSNNDNWLIDNALDFDRVLAITYYGRSGSVFLQSLLDSHPQIIMIPATIMACYVDFWNTYLSTENANINALFLEYFKPLFNVNAAAMMDQWKQVQLSLGFNKMGEKGNEISTICKFTFSSILDKLLEKHTINRKSFFQMIHVAYAICCGQSDILDHEKIPTIVYALHSPDVNYRNSALKDDFPNYKMIQMVRNPIQTLGSHFKHHYGAGYLLEMSFNDAFLPKKSANVRAVRLEDLHQHPKDTLIKIIQWINIPWSNSLMHSTFNNLKWRNASEVIFDIACKRSVCQDLITADTGISGFNTITIARNHDKLFFNIDKLKIKVLFAKRYKNWNYSIKKPRLLKTISILPLLAIPSKLEIISLIELRKLKRLTVKTIWGAWKQQRKLLVKMWLYALSNEIHEKSLL